MDTQEARIYFAVIAAVVLLVIIISFFAVSVIRQQRRNLALQKANALAEISAMEKERARIAADLHDDLGPVLSVIKFRVDHVEHVDEEEKKELVKASGQLDELIARMREVANNLMPSALQRKGLIAAIEEFISNVERSSGLQVSFDDLTRSPISEDKSIHIYRIVQECVHNSMKHSKAAKMNISFEEKNGLLKIVCRDNGSGFDINKTMNESSGIGLKSLRNRSEMMGGNMVIESKLTKGSAFIFEIPVK